MSIGKRNQVMKVGHLIEHNMRNIFLEKSYTECGEDTICRSFSKKSKLSLSLDQRFIFIVCQVEGHLQILKISCRPVAFTS